MQTELILSSLIRISDNGSGNLRAPTDAEGRCAQPVDQARRSPARFTDRVDGIVGESEARAPVSRRAETDISRHVRPMQRPEHTPPVRQPGERVTTAPLEADGKLGLTEEKRLGTVFGRPHEQRGELRGGVAAQVLRFIDQPRCRPAARPKPGDGRAQGSIRRRVPRGLNAEGVQEPRKEPVGAGPARIPMDDGPVPQDLLPKDGEERRLARAALSGDQRDTLACAEGIRHGAQDRADARCSGRRDRG